MKDETSVWHQQSRPLSGSHGNRCTVFSRRAHMQAESVSYSLRSILLTATPWLRWAIYAFGTKNRHMPVKPVRTDNVTTTSVFDMICPFSSVKSSLLCFFSSAKPSRSISNCKSLFRLIPPKYSRTMVLMTAPSRAPTRTFTSPPR